MKSRENQLSTQRSIELSTQKFDFEFTFFFIDIYIFNNI